MTKYSITVTIDPKALPNLLGGKYYLVLVRDMGVDGKTRGGNIIFATFSPLPEDEHRLSASNTFAWEEDYQVYATASGFKDGNPVSTGSEQKGLRRGETADIRADGTVIGGAVDDTKPLRVLNHWKDNAHIVISCKNPNSQSAEVTPHYISDVTVSGTDSNFTPVQSFSVFFKRDAKTKNMVEYSETVRGHFEIVQGQTDCTVNYIGGEIPDDKHWLEVKNAKKVKA